ncbi:integumentary mucin A.1-like [Polistes fuscatus]|uniref:integumentary mucin A.1-like n=1 Tax=Polistes fuscatus TaxID=30207 RepID=UPI001CA932EF|nr:integumentary mucin A.1-like [Polistes fuscatus]
MPRGWRPSGRYFNPGHSQPHAYYRPRPGPSNAITYPAAFSPPSNIPTTPSTSTIPTTTTTTTPITTTTTERTREPTTQPNLPDETFDTNPALAIANSFAFNRPVYVYNTFPFLPGHVLVK